jgi:NADP-dependent 3-hydroxy acid dehydrogenase YdfG
MRILVIGATGDVGSGVVTACLRRGWDTVAVARTESALQDLAREHSNSRLSTIVGSLDDEQSTKELAYSANAGTLTGVVVAAAGPWTATPVADCGWDTIAQAFERQLRPHVNAARTFIPGLPDGAVYLAIGGGMADAIFPGMAPMSMTQAAQRNLIRGWHREHRDGPVAIKELIIAAMVNGRRTRAHAAQDWLTDKEIGEYAADVLTAPEQYPGAILTLSTRDVRGT